ncbi:class I SAM-dependent RNA methyltransferase [Sinisalibacter lacisalsi]|uniref:RNA methyltransferase n=1 Tax=Sinisalibacter lacisalsi TaxID=1526570 RepID=A0ABQ1QBC2_9RHOB|nr:RsmD family RNA methyltransferase [Sinisalibacter lacisalsi]GGD21350.1 RNA methyltransferase [Sinisalibacter lacisalsi]
MQVTIERLGHRGDGVAPGPVFVPRALPGEIIEGTEVDGRIDNPKIVSPSPDRVRPPCVHYKACGGCALQHASDEFVAGWKADVVSTALSARGIETKIAGIETSPPFSRRRAVLSARRTKAGPLIGFHAPKSDAISRIPECRLLHPGLMNAMPALESLVDAGGSRKGTLRIAIALSQTGPDVSVTGGKPLDPILASDLARIADEAGIARLIWDGEPVALVAAPVQAFGKARVVPPPGAFLQATVEGEAALLREVCRAVLPGQRVLDLFAGCGTFSLPLAEQAEVHAVEGEAAMLAALDAGWREAPGLKRVTTESRDLFRRPLLADELNRFDAIVIDPPRAGAEAQMNEIGKSGVARVASVSCNPVTFARDSQILLAAGFRLDRLVVVDQFRWSTHVEIVAGFSRG